MSHPNAAPPAWYPDPDGRPGLQRYWDGARWTEHYHPPLAPAAASAPAKPARRPLRSRRGLLIGLAAGALVLVLGIVSAVVFLPRILTSPMDRIDTTASEVYDFTEPMLDLAPDHEFQIPADYDLDALAAETQPNLGDEFGDIFSTSFAFEVFYDSALTLRAPSLVIQYEPGKPVHIRSSELGVAWTADSREVAIGSDDYGSWGLHDEYFLVRKLDRDGSVLEKPVVTRFTVQRELDAPVVTFATPANDGSIELSWQEVPGATRYVVVTSNEGTGDIASRSHDVLAEVEGTSWSSSQSVDEVDVAPYAVRQNENMQLYTGSSADDLASGWVYEGRTQGYDIGVIATDGELFSPYTAHDLGAVAGALPFERAFTASRNAKTWGASGFIEGIENVQRQFYFTSLDGATRATVGYMDAAETRDLGDRWVFALRGRGTLLGEWVPVLKSSAPDPAAAVAQYNELAAAAAPPTGMPQFETVAAPIDEFAAGVAEPPATDYPVFGSTEFTRFLAQHMIGQTTVIDITEFASAPGSPDPFDAAHEAMYQNPYVLNVSGLNLSSDGTKLYVAYDIPADEAADIRLGIRDAVDEAVGAAIRDGMSDAEKVTALNDWLAARTEYDYEALAALDANVWGGIPAGYHYAWNASGVLVDGRGVCASYAAAFAALVHAVDVPVVVVNGDVLAGGPHAWNKVFVDGAWLAVDPTWNDSAAPNRYLMIPDAGFTGPAERSEGTSWMIDWSIPEYAA